MEKKFEVEFLQEAVRFMNGLDKKSQEKIYYNIRKAQVTNDPVLFKKLTATIWEFRTLYNQTAKQEKHPKPTSKKPNVSENNTLNKKSSSYACKKDQNCLPGNYDG